MGFVIYSLSYLSPSPPPKKSVRSSEERESLSIDELDEGVEEMAKQKTSNDNAETDRGSASRASID